MKDLAKQEFLKDQAKLEFGTQIQFIEYSFDNFIGFGIEVIGSPTYIGSLITSLIFYIKFGTN